MSLRVWLPLNGTLDNQGLDDIAVTNNGATIDNSGKIGKCYSFDGSDDYISLTGNCLYNIIKGGTNSFSISFWIYQADSTRAIIFGDYGLAGGIGFNIELTISHRIRFYWNGSPDLGISQINIGTTTWNHVVLVYDTIHLYGYLNGNLVYTYTGTLTVKNKTSGSYYIGRDSRTGSTALNGKMNDVRIYDHALSSFEVKQISQGLILHYPLNNNGWGQENLLINSYGTIIDKRNNTLNSRTEYFAWNVGNSYTNITVSTLVTISFDLEMYINDISSYSGQLKIYNTNNKGPVQIRDVSYFFKDEYSVGDTINKRVYLSTNLIPRDNATQTSNYIEFYTGYGSNNFYKISNVKLELGLKATPWCPNEADELYSTLGLNDNILYDTSGYCNNGTRTGTFSWTSDTPKYLVSTYMPKSALITHPCPVFGGINQEWTCAMWVKLDNVTQRQQAMNNFNISNNIVHNTTPLLYLNDGANDYYMYGSQAVSAGVWTHVVFVFKNSDGTRNVYINGVLKNNYGPNKTSIPKGIPDTVTVGTNLAGYISDYRVYATALSADDVKSLYQNSAYIDNQSNIYGAVYEEV